MRRSLCPRLAPGLPAKAPCPWLFEECAPQVVQITFPLMEADIFQHSKKEIQTFFLPFHLLQPHPFWAAWSQTVAGCPSTVPLPSCLLLLPSTFSLTWHKFFSMTPFGVCPPFSFAWCRISCSHLWQMAEKYFDDNFVLNLLWACYFYCRSCWRPYALYV